MTRNEVLTLICLVLLLVTDAALIYMCVTVKRGVDSVEETVNNVKGSAKSLLGSIPIVGQLLG